MCKKFDGRKRWRWSFFWAGVFSTVYTLGFFYAGEAVKLMWIVHHLNYCHSSRPMQCLLCHLHAMKVAEPVSFLWFTINCIWCVLQYSMCFQTINMTITVKKLVRPGLKTAAVLLNERNSTSTLHNIYVIPQMEFRRQTAAQLFYDRFRGVFGANSSKSDDFVAI